MGENDERAETAAGKYRWWLTSITSRAVIQCDGMTWVADWTTRDAIKWAVAEIDRLRAAIAEHHDQKADDRCIEDDDRLYAAAGLPPCDRRVGDKAAMLQNCSRFIARRCEGGGWPSYAELEAEIARLRAEKAATESAAGSVAADSPH